jgi:HNH endonuclease
MAALHHVGFEGAVMTDLLKQVAAPPPSDSTTKGLNPSGLCMCGCGRMTSLAPQSYTDTGQVKGTPMRFMQGHRIESLGKRLPVKERLLGRIRKVPGRNGCWLWLGTKDTSGYGQLSVVGRMTLVHRISFELFRGKIPPNKQVLHKCDTPACIRPKHLFLGNDVINSRDRVAKGRQARGEGNARSKLTNEDVVNIRKQREEGYTLEELSKEFGVCTAQIWLICKRRFWKHIQ